MKIKTFTDIERECALTFQVNRPWWHLYTSGKDTPVFLVTEDDYKFSMNLMARCSADLTGADNIPGYRPEAPFRADIIAFALMSNHIHIILSGTEENAMAFFRVYRRRLIRHLTMKGTPLKNGFRAELKEIQDIRSLRNAIAYVHRNGFVVNKDFTPFSYPWGTGSYYFNLPGHGMRHLGDMAWNSRLALLKGRIGAVSKSVNIIDGYICPSSYCKIALGTAIFHDAHQYFFHLSKNVESYQELAEGLDDGEFLTDNELFAALVKCVSVDYGQSSIKELSMNQKFDLAKKMRFKWKSSNGQIRRMLGLSQWEVDALFPLSAER